MAPNHPGVGKEPAAAGPNGMALSFRARLAILLLGAAVAIASVLLAASSFELLERGDDIDDAVVSPIEWHDVGQPSAG